MTDQHKLQELVQRAEEMQALYEQVESNNKALRDTIKELGLMHEQMAKLIAYYHGEWIKDRELLRNHPVRDKLMFAEDPIFDEIQLWDKNLKKIRKTSKKLLKELGGAEED
ncbi:MAG: DUF4298 domain-containing protein [Clostridiales bacterium]|nr:DUF4298 domain-containing protein [Clostridiales bacterium]